jgi:hypothetical protein
MNIETQKMAAMTIARAFCIIRHESARVMLDPEKIHVLADIGIYAWGLLTGARVDITRVELMDEIENAGMMEFYSKNFAKWMGGDADEKF